MVGVSINIFIKHKDSTRNDLGKVHYKDIFGTRKQKLDFLTNNTLQNIDFELINPEPPFYEFCPKSDNFDDLKAQYERGFKLDKLMGKNVQGFKSGQDSLVIKNTKEELEDFISNLISDSTDVFVNG